MTDEDGKRFDEPVYEMLWDCRYCGSEKLLGKTHRHCPNCGATQDPESRYFPPEDEKVPVQEHIFFGADLVCPACSSTCGARCKFCGSCGSPLGDAEAAKAVSTEPPAAQAPPPSGVRWLKRLAGGLLLIVLLLVAFKLLNGWLAKQEHFTVAGRSWMRSVGVERYGPVSRSSWCDEIPAGAFEVRRKREQRGNRRVPDGQECTKKNVDNRDGTFRQTKECRPKYRQEPLYADKCYFRINTWEQIRKEQLEGTDLEPRWPAPELKSCPTALNGCERGGIRSARYTAALKGGAGSAFSCDLEESVWRSLEDGGSYTGRLGGLTGSLDCGSLRPLPTRGD